MNTLREAAEAYLQLRRALGFKLTQSARWLQDFVAFMEQRQAAVITTELALQWAIQPDCVYRRKRPLRPKESGRRFRDYPAPYSAGIRPPEPGQSGHRSSTDTG